MANHLQEARTVLYSEAEQVAAQHGGMPGNLPQGLADQRQFIRRQSLEARNLLRLGGAAGSVSNANQFGSALNAHARILDKELQRLQLGKDDIRVDGLRKEAALAECARLFRGGSPDAGTAYLAALRQFPGDMDLQRLACHLDEATRREHRQLLGFRFAKRYDDAAFDKVFSVCTLEQGLWCGTSTGYIRRFSSSGEMLEEYLPDTCHIEKIFMAPNGNVWACDPVARVLVVIKPGQGVLQRIDLAACLKEPGCHNGVSGCGGPHGVFLSVTDGASGRATFYRADDRFALHPIQETRGYHYWAQTREAVLTMEGFTRQVRSLADPGNVLFTPKADVFDGLVRITSLNADAVLLYSKNVIAGYTLQGALLFKTTMRRYTEEYCCIGTVERDWRVENLLHLVNVYQPKIYRLETPA